MHYIPGVGTYVFEDGQLVGTKEGDLTQNPLAASGEIPTAMLGLEAPVATPKELQYNTTNKLNDIAKNVVVNAAAELPFSLTGNPKGTAGLIARILGSAATSAGTEAAISPEHSNSEIMGNAIINSILGGGALAKQTMKLPENASIAPHLGTSWAGRLMGWLDPRGLKLVPKTETIMKQAQIPPGVEVVEPAQLPDIPGVPKEQVRWAKTPDKTVEEKIRGRVPKGVIVTVPQPQAEIPPIPGLPPGASARFVKPPDLVLPKDYKPGQVLPEQTVKRVIPGVSKEPPPTIRRGGQFTKPYPETIPIRVSNLRKALAGLGVNTAVDLTPLLNDLYGREESPPMP